MNLDQLFTNLSHNELRNLSTGAEGVGDIPASHHPRLVNLTNEALTALHTRFELLKKQLIIDAADARTEYILRKEHAVTDTTVGVAKYIRDTAEAPYPGDLLQILRIFDEEGCEVPLNAPEKATSLYTINFETLQIPQPVTGNSYWVIYKANHPVLAHGDLSQEITLPPPLYPALPAYIAHAVFASMNGEEHVARAQEHLTTYERICAQIEQKNIVQDSPGNEVDRFTLGGWC